MSGSRPPRSRGSRRSLPGFEPGHVWLAGAGPGGLGCLTLEVVAALAEADAVVYDALVDPAALRAAARARSCTSSASGAASRRPQQAAINAPARRASPAAAPGCCG